MATLMKFLSLFLLLASCASTTFYHEGKPVARFQGDMTKVKFAFAKDGTFTWSADTVDHSTPTIAAGKTSAGNIAASGAALATSGIAF